MGYIIVIALIVGDLWLYAHGARLEKSIWRDESIWPR